MSVASHASKGKTFYTTDSLKARVAIMAAIQVIGYYHAWHSIFSDFNLTMDANLCNILRRMDDKKEKKRNKSATHHEKKKHSNARVEKLSTAHEADMKVQQEGIGYGQDIAMTQAKKQMKANSTTKVMNSIGALPP